MNALNRQLKNNLFRNQYTYRDYISLVFPENFLVDDYQRAFANSWKLLSGQTGAHTSCNSVDAEYLRAGLFSHLNENSFTTAQKDEFLQSLGAKTDVLRKRLPEVKDLFESFSKAAHGRPDFVKTLTDEQRRTLEHIQAIYKEEYELLEKIDNPDTLSDMNIGCIAHILLITILLDPNPEKNNALVSDESLSKAHEWIIQLQHRVISSELMGVPEDLEKYRIVLEENVFKTIVDDYKEHQIKNQIYETPQLLLSLLKSDSILNRKFYWYKFGEFRSLEEYLTYVDKKNAENSTQKKCQFNNLDSIKKISDLIKEASTLCNDELITAPYLTRALLLNPSSGTARHLKSVFSDNCKNDNFLSFLERLSEEESMLG